mmetsp:Transcript_2704/g.7944  ORF Transcript_2704/g.7944 Transcript_2704/m.7944 type:complete len:295 (-) Transcript_2704:188-1072(-)
MPKVRGVIVVASVPIGVFDNYHGRGTRQASERPDHGRLRRLEEEDVGPADQVVGVVAALRLRRGGREAGHVLLVAPKHLGYPRPAPSCSSSSCSSFENGRVVADVEPHQIEEGFRRADAVPSPLRSGVAEGGLVGQRDVGPERRGREARRPGPGPGPELEDGQSAPRPTADGRPRARSVSFSVPPRWSVGGAAVSVPLEVGGQPPRSVPDEAARSDLRPRPLRDLQNGGTHDELGAQRGEGGETERQDVDDVRRAMAQPGQPRPRGSCSCGQQFQFQFQAFHGHDGAHQRSVSF